MGNDNSLINNSLISTIVGLFLGAILYIILLNLLTGISIPPYYDSPAYSLAIYESIMIFGMYGFILSGAYIGWSITYGKKSEEYYAVRKTLVIMGILSIIWIVLTIIFYFFKIDIGRSSTDIIMAIILLISILYLIYLSSIDGNHIDKEEIGMWTGMLGGMIVLEILNIIRFVNL